MNNLKKPRKKVVLDHSYPYEELLMILQPEEAALAEFVIPEGFRFARKEEIPGLKNQWTSLMHKLEFPFSEEESEEFFDQMLNSDPEFFANHLYALLDSEDRLASVVGIWPGRHFDQALRIHWMMSDPDYQSKGLARTVMKQAIADYYREYPDRELYLSTQAQSWPAIRMYEKLGFRSFEDDCNISTKEENENRWANARKAVMEKEGVQI